ncbi:uncharacterized protein F4822DRAFT_123948 [Hypoxylon trugodes]|uniref:uncharacterized protein n=1 Tax=Hypoxylon trugodes TaxID=326681 RepID=UPI002191C84A|nr:uncharacterized protein F4822DRAFT_123948 [Hypoxylon trugodes]KAI1392301.1 hypothetical protein F4822DRAFT_123948 [Hypoxylon trugodes]
MGILLLVISSILLFLSVASFIPQYSRILSRGDCSRISPYYVLFNFIVATEQLTISLHFIIVNDAIMDNIVHTPPVAGDWLNLAQFSTVWVCQLILFGLYLRYSSLTRTNKYWMIVVYIAYFLISGVPVIIESTLIPPSSGSSFNESWWYSVVFFYIHSVFINPVITALAIASLFPQRKELLLYQEIGALSPTGLVAQTTIFTIVAFLWIVRIPLPWGVRFTAWYQVVGWAAVDNLIFALVQGILCWESRKLKSVGHTTDDESAPLLPSE